MLVLENFVHQLHSTVTGPGASKYKSLSRNPQFMQSCHKTWLNPKIKVSASQIQGIGMFAASDFEIGEKVLIWGDCYTDKAGALLARSQGKGTMQWDEDVFSYETAIDAEKFSINHSCDPNCWMSDAFTLIARKVIKLGEELTADYALWEIGAESGSSWVCNCGSELCRGKVTGHDWKDKALQERYMGHFSPLINKLIARAN